MGLDNPIHIAFLLILLLLVFGAKRLPEMGRSLGGGMRGFKESLSGESAQPSLGTQAQQQTPAATAPEAQVAAPVAIAAPVLAPVAQPAAVQVDEPGTPSAA